MVDGKDGTTHLDEVTKQVEMSHGASTEDRQSATVL